ncbi:peptidoglycan editing factor PgeF [Bacillus sp. DNRA2]|uniref:peptidoglycan editing factor PgeF n=1 Tax=Bacillus sp. DNRA2 TaxID=2723053 RepID=UPI00145D0A97|nr:peptidoglycan editing factor PgeF [Bacillus sp. DNRA2]NMD69423.1 peptidoglycan editing factor PgeF [Bacillus sp. DNRA2]
MEPFILKGTSFFEIEEWTKAHPDLVAGFTTKHGGVSTAPFASLNFGFHVGDNPEKVCENRSSLAAQINFPLQQWVCAEQTHETNIRKVTKADCGKGALAYDDAFKKTDGFYTTESGILLTLAYADCVPLYFFAPKQRVIGVAHAGWKGTVAGIAIDMISMLQTNEWINPDEVEVVIGPSICGNCYIVDEPVIAHLQNKLEAVEEKPYNLIGDNQYQLNLREVNQLLLISAGVHADKIKQTKFCTSCHWDAFFSHRKDGGKTGRMISFIGWKED